MAPVIGIYNADGSLSGELRYALAKLVGRSDCALCDITHGWNPRGKSSWRSARRACGFDMRVIHRDEATAEQLAAAPRLPCFVTEGPDGWQVVLEADDIAQFGGRPDELLAEIRRRVAG